MRRTVHHPYDDAEQAVSTLRATAGPHCDADGPALQTGLEQSLLVFPASVPLQAVLCVPSSPC